LKKSKEILIGETSVLDFLAHQAAGEDSQPHPLQEVVEEALALLTEDLRDVFYMRYGLGMTIRAIAREQEYDGHQIIQYKLEKVHEAVRSAVERHNNQG
jgi:DNA-directed RNA polymerase specialized sigma24 family protein